MDGGIQVQSEPDRDSTFSFTAAFGRGHGADPITHDIPVIFVTALGEEENEVQGVELGAIGCTAEWKRGRAIELIWACGVNGAGVQEQVAATIATVRVQLDCQRRVMKGPKRAIAK